MAIIKRYRNKKTFYQAELFIKGFRVSTKTFPTKREAFIWHEEEKCKLTFNPERLNDRMTLSECVEKFWKDIQSRVSKSTLQTYEFALKEYFSSGPLASLKMEEIKEIKVTEWISWLREHPTAKNKKRKSFVKELDLLKTILNWYKNFLNEDFNVPVTKKHKQMCFFKPVSPRRPDYFMKAKEARTWVEWLKQHRSNPVYWRLASFMLLTGARVGEACGLKWELLILSWV